MKENKYTLKANNKFSHEITEKDLESLDFVSSGKGGYHIIKNGKSYQANIQYVDKQRKIVSLSIGEEVFELKIKDSYDELVEQLGLSLKVTHQINEIKAPMPGLVLSIDVTEGQEVLQGDPLLVLEAMKMENVIKSPGDGIVKAIVAEKGKPVDKGEILIIMD